MFEIGSSLREARERQGLELSKIEGETRIRAKFLHALEDERFDHLPAPTYVRGFLRTYAGYLGLDAQRFVDEYNTRFAPEEEPRAAAPVRIVRPGRWRHRLLVALPIVLVAGVVAWGVSLNRNHQSHRAAVTPSLHHTRLRTSTPTPPRHPRPATTVVARIALVAARGPCWLSVRVRSAGGPLIYERTLAQGLTAHFAGRSLWIRLGAPWNVDATLNGKPVLLPGTIGNVLATASGLRPG